MKETNQKVLIEQENEMRKQKLSVAKTSLQYVLEQKPEVIKIKIEGLKEQIRKLKPMIARKKKMLKKQDFDSQEIPGMNITEAAIGDGLKIGADLKGQLENRPTPRPNSSDDGLSRSEPGSDQVTA